VRGGSGGPPPGGATGEHGKVRRAAATGGRVV